MPFTVRFGVECEQRFLAAGQWLTIGRSWKRANAESCACTLQGAMVRIDEHNWIKTGIEYFEGRMRLSTVVTYEYSSWVVAELPESTSELALLLTRRRDALEVRYRIDHGAQELAALVHLPPDSPALAGAMCAAPEGNGFQVTFRDLSLVAL